MLNIIHKYSLKEFKFGYIVTKYLATGNTEKIGLISNKLQQKQFIRRGKGKPCSYKVTEIKIDIQNPTKFYHEKLNMDIFKMAAKRTSGFDSFIAIIKLFITITMHRTIVVFVLVCHKTNSHKIIYLFHN